MTHDALTRYVTERLVDKTYNEDPRCREVVRAFNALYYGVHGASQPWYKNHWKGVRVLKCPEDLFIYQEIIWRTRPNVIIECGVAFGGSTLFLADMLDLIGGGLVLAVDVSLLNVHPRAAAHRRVRLFEGSSTSDAVRARIREFVRHEARVMVILDSDHSTEHVRAELETYSALVTPGNYLIVEDTNIDGYLPEPRPGPRAAADAFLLEHPEFERDQSSERLLVTFNPGGYLVRKPKAGP
jgi:cephalosporin hydroxylase